ncbi:hypothetical protein CPB83DRAFT_862250 [Crepidotus variabilis]|uniref:BPL/LPL catalytic domain-containing protein n=1 Tax=Crepidotus variabilis TaxID=179855 RepID=A0A9P6E6X4_9AGAR|nr:hypothetical protein CPB83DRAFT_862250 [Crepidotus variabilis]
MNVLVYSGPEILQLSLTHALSSLRAILLPHYTVQPITAPALKTQPWRLSCALLVLPQSRDSHREGFMSPASQQIKEYVEGGGKCLMFGVRATLHSRSGSLGFGLSGGLKGLTLGLEGDDGPAEVPLKFSDQVRNRRLTFGYLDDNEHLVIKPSIITLNAFQKDFKGIYDSGLPKLNGFQGAEEVSILGRFPCNKSELGPIAGLKIGINEGELVVWSPSIEFPLTEEPASSIEHNISTTEIQAVDDARREVLAKVLVALGLQLPAKESHSSVTGANPIPYSKPLPQFLVSSPRCPNIVRDVLNQLQKAPFVPSASVQMKVLKDSVDIFQLYSSDTTNPEEFLTSVRDPVADQASEKLSTVQHKKIISYSDGRLPDSKLTPLFKLVEYFDSLKLSRERQGVASLPEIGNPWGIGEALLYGEAVTSTQTLFDNNPSFSSNLPTPILSLASHQLAGRGRGANIWLSPSGCLQFSLLLRVPLSETPTSPAFKPAKLVFVQYLFALAVVEACRDDIVLGENLGGRVRIKWPNDIYADVGVDGKEDLKKIGGVLVNTSFQGGMVDIIIGCGINVLNSLPIASLLQLKNLHSSGNQSKDSPTMEKTAAAIMTRFEEMWNTFILKGSFEPFLGLYLKRWLHSDQLVTLTTTNPPIKVRIVGITAEHGLLRTMPERRTSATGLLGSYAARVDGDSSDTGEYVDLQPDGNSFDLMAGLIRTKT